ncbi:MFS transporter [Nonomuraea sp. ATR24]|uniref:MFS transporter n=1 Tax=Nonomuraea TaxID=83681 RepID=UPI001C5DEBF4|nr:MFS transporter [Nonomuraea ceibae]
MRSTGGARGRPRLPKRLEFPVAWTSSALSTVGTRTLHVAYPLLALAQTGSPTAAGWTGFALTIPILVFYVPGGLVVDRLSPRTIMFVAELGRFLTVLSVLASLAFGEPHLVHLILAALLEGTLWVMYNLAETSLLPSLVEPVKVRSALAKSEGAGHLASLAGRPLGGYLFGLGAMVPFVLNAVLFFLSSLLTLPLLRRSGPRPPRASLLHDLSGGFRVLRRQVFLRGAITLVTLTNLLVNTLVMIFIAGSEGMSPLTIGLVLAVGGVGGALGALRAHYRKPSGSTLLVHAWIWAGAMFLAMVGALLQAVLGTTWQLWPIFFALAFITTGYGGAMSNVAIRVTEVEHIAPRELARVIGVSRLSSYGALCFAAPLGGLLVTWCGIEGGSIVLFVLMLVLALAATYLPGVRNWLTPPLPSRLYEQHTPAQAV